MLEALGVCFSKDIFLRELGVIGGIRTEPIPIPIPRKRRLSCNVLETLFLGLKSVG